MVMRAPKIDARTAAEIEAQVVCNLQRYIGDAKPNGNLQALIKIFARYCEIIIDRLNRVPEKNLLAFLNLLGASRLPPQPARVPLTFSLAKGAPVDALVPKGTQVAVLMPGGETQPVIFETQRDLEVIAVDNISLICNDSLNHGVDGSINVNQIDPKGTLFKLPLLCCFSLHKNKLEHPKGILSLYISVAEQDAEDLSSNNSHINWTYWDGKACKPLAVDDGTDSLRRSGIVRFLLPSDAKPESANGCSDCYCLQMSTSESDNSTPFKVKGIWLNTVMAAQAISIHNEVLGSSDGTENQRLRTARSPVLGGSLEGAQGLQLEVREQEVPSQDDLEKLTKGGLIDPVTTIADSTGRPKVIWVRWRQVADFYDSGPRDRHYLINHLNGEIQFGDGQHGMIPPLGKSNIRMAFYQTGGGVMGNQPSGSITQLKTTVPYVNGVTNHVPATGGAEAELIEGLMDRMPRSLRHQGRAVSLEDYEDLAMEASPEVARSKCLPIHDASKPSKEGIAAPGMVSIIIVPRSQDPEPKPGAELVGRVDQFIKDRSDPTISLVVKRPSYVKVNVTAELVVASLDAVNVVRQAAAQSLADFLHPLTGGFDGRGWGFDRLPYKSDLYRFMEGIAGVDHVHSLTVNTDNNELASNQRACGFLVASGDHNLTVTPPPR